MMIFTIEKWRLEIQKKKKTENHNQMFPNQTNHNDIEKQ